MKPRNLLYSAIGILFTGIGAYFAFTETNSASDARAVSSFFAQSLPDEKGKMHPLSQWKGKMLVVNFWATWCAPCIEEIPELSELQTEISTKNAQVIGIGIDSPSNIAEFSSKRKIAYPLYVARMSGGELSRQFGDQVGALPFTVLITADGKVRKTYLGRLKINQLRNDLALN